MKKTVVITLFAAILYIAQVESQSDGCALIALGSGDPHLLGFRGQRFEFHGEDGGVYSLLSAPYVQFNAEMIGNAQWGESRTYIGKLAAMTGSGSKFALGCEQGQPSIVLNGELLGIGVHAIDGGYVALPNERIAIGDTVTASVAEYIVSVTFQKNQYAACYIDLELKLSQTQSENIHGVLGQTVFINPNDAVKSSGALEKYWDGFFELDGDEEDYRIPSDELFGMPEMNNRYTGESVPVVNNKQRNLLGEGLTAAFEGPLFSQNVNGRKILQTLECDLNGECVDDICQCSTGYYGDGFTCFPELSWFGMCFSEVDCDSLNATCSANALCVCYEGQAYNPYTHMCVDESAEILASDGSSSIPLSSCTATPDCVADHGADTVCNTGVCNCQTGVWNSETSTCE